MVKFNNNIKYPGELVLKKKTGAKSMTNKNQSPSNNNLLAIDLKIRWSPSVYSFTSFAQVGCELLLFFNNNSVLAPKGYFLRL